MRPSVIALLMLFSGVGTTYADFMDVASATGVALDARKDGGLCAADFDGDDLLDLVVHTRTGSFLLRNLGDSFSDITATHAPSFVSMELERSCVAADWNHDGYPDILRNTTTSIHLHLNRGPTGSPAYSFAATPDFELTVADIADQNSEGVAAIDVDGDGWLDIAVQDEGGARIYRNPADGTVAFVQVDPAVTTLPVGGLDGDYLAATDWDVDGRVDLGIRLGQQPDFWHNEGGNRFAATPVDLGAPNGDKGSIRFCDFDADGDFDFIFTEGDSADAGVNRIWTWDGATFTATAEPAIPSSPNVDDAACADVDNDGDLDVFVSTDADDTLWINQLTETGEMRFVQEARGIDSGGNGEGVLFFDFDRDGDEDLLVNQRGPDGVDAMGMSFTRPGENAFFLNDTDDRSYLMVRVLTEVSACPDRVFRDDIGAVVSVAQVGGAFDSGVREVNGGQGHGSQGSPILHFGLPNGPDESYEVTVRFLAGSEPDAVLPVSPTTFPTGAYRLLTVQSTDPDGDGITTANEMADVAAAGIDPDLDMDGLPAWHDADADGDGTPDLVEGGGDPCTPANDANADGVPDYLQDVDLGDRDGDLVPDAVDRDPDDPMVCADADADGCDDCSVAGQAQPANDGPDADGDGICDLGEGDGGTGVDAGAAGLQVHGSGCLCGAARARDDLAWLWLLAGVAILRRLTRRRSR